MTSRDVVNFVVKTVKSQKVGHAGTLDPLATGVLVVGVGPATRLINYVQAMPKTYVGSFRLGIESSTEDRLGELNEITNAPVIGRDELANVLKKFVGKIEQIPPAHSALKINGKRAYELARKGVQLSLEPRTVEIFSLELPEFDYPDFKLKIKCGSGTYVRSLGRDIARSLDTGAIMTELERTSIGCFDLCDSITISELGQDSLVDSLCPALDAVSELPQVTVDGTMIQEFSDGKFLRVATANQLRQLPLPQNCQAIVAVDCQKRLIAIMERFDANNFKPKTNFAHYWRSA